MPVPGLSAWLRNLPFPVVSPAHREARRSAGAVLAQHTVHSLCTGRAPARPRGHEVQSILVTVGLPCVDLQLRFLTCAFSVPSRTSHVPRSPVHPCLPVHHSAFLLVPHCFSFSVPPLPSRPSYPVPFRLSPCVIIRSFLCLPVHHFPFLPLPPRSPFSVSPFLLPLYLPSPPPTLPLSSRDARASPLPPRVINILRVQSAPLSWLATLAADGKQTTTSPPRSR